MGNGKLFMICSALAAFGLACAQALGRPGSPAALNRRADSLAALDPAAELRKAINRGDLRFIAVCGLVCAPPGVDPADSVVLAAIRSRSLHYIEGTSDVLANDAVARLNRVATDYADRYNRLLVRHLRLRE